MHLWGKAQSEKCPWISSLSETRGRLADSSETHITCFCGVSSLKSSLRPRVWRVSCRRYLQRKPVFTAQWLMFYRAALTTWVRLLSPVVLYQCIQQRERKRASGRKQQRVELLFSKCIRGFVCCLHSQCGAQIWGRLQFLVIVGQQEGVWSLRTAVT